MPELTLAEAIVNQLCSGITKCNTSNLNAFKIYFHLNDRRNKHGPGFGQSKGNQLLINLSQKWKIELLLIQLGLKFEKLDGFEPGKNQSHKFAARSKLNRNENKSLSISERTKTDSFEVFGKAKGNPNLISYINLPKQTMCKVIKKIVIPNFVKGA